MHNAHTQCQQMYSTSDMLDTIAEAHTFESEKNLGSQAAFCAQVIVDTCWRWLPMVAVLSIQDWMLCF